MSEDRNDRPFNTEQYIEAIRRWPMIATQALNYTEDTAELVDIAGELHQATQALARARRRWQVELENGDSGKQWRVKQGRQAVRSYNMMSLVKKFQEAWRHGSALVTIMQLIEEDVLRVDWQWTKLQRLATKYGIGLATIQEQPVSNGDPTFDVGAVWVDDTLGYERVSEEE